ncbi:MAG: DMT family transporter [Spirulina sp. DLM2.Bin59]|nr:MAG: DMT family transporter [Spirulina sp. DLM2.Bin59]
MGQLDRPSDLSSATPDTAQESLSSLTQELETLKHSLVAQLKQEISQLQDRKTALLAENVELERSNQAQRQQQQELAQQLAPIIAEQLLQYIRNQSPQLEGNGLINGSGPIGDYNNNAYRLISSLDTTLRTTFRTLQQDLSSYQSTLSQQLGQMYSLEQQGEAILDALVSRLRTELSTDTAVRDTHPVQPVQPPRTVGQDPVLDRQPTPPGPQIVPPAPPPKKVAPSQMQLGFILVMFSSLALSLQNVVISIILNPSTLFGMVELGGYISPSFGNSLVILFMRMVVVVPLMAVLAQTLYPESWPAIGRFLRSQDWVAFANMIGCGFFLFASSALIYMALGALSPGVAITLFFVFPIVTVLCSWLFFGEKPSLIRATATAIVFFGVVMISNPFGTDASTIDPAGVAAAIGAGVTFAFHVLLIQACTKKLHPVPFSVVNFAVILIFSALSLFFPYAQQSIIVEPTMWTPLIFSGLVLGALTLLSYLANNIGISYIGAARASIFGASGPALTSILAWLIIGRNMLLIQVFGMVIVSLGVLGQNLERLIGKKAK